MGRRDPPSQQIPIRTELSNVDYGSVERRIMAYRGPKGGPDALKVGDRVYHRRSDLFGSVKAIDALTAKVKYEPPWDQKASPEQIPLSELVPAHYVDRD